MKLWKPVWANYCKARKHLCCPTCLIPTLSLYSNMLVKSEHLSSLTLESIHHIKRTDHSIGYAKMRSLAKRKKKIYIYLHFIGNWASYLSYFIFVFFFLSTHCFQLETFGEYEKEGCAYPWRQNILFLLAPPHICCKMHAGQAVCSQYDVADTVFT